MALIYPGIWGVLQPVTPRVDYTTSLLYPYVLGERINLPQPVITQQDSYLRLSQYSFAFGDQFSFKKSLFTPASNMQVTIVYRTYSFGDSLPFVKSLFTPASNMIVTIAYQSTSTSDSLSLSTPYITGTMTVVINYVNTAVNDTLTMRKPTFTAASSLT